MSRSIASAPAAADPRSADPGRSEKCAILPEIDVWFELCRLAVPRSSDGLLVVAECAQNELPGIN